MPRAASVPARLSQAGSVITAERIWRRLKGRTRPGRGACYYSIATSYTVSSTCYYQE